jgi:hypothetical protein
MTVRTHFLPDMFLILRVYFLVIIINTNRPCPDYLCWTNPMLNRTVRMLKALHHYTGLRGKDYVTGFKIQVIILRDGCNKMKL